MEKAVTYCKVLSDAENLGVQGFLDAWCDHPGFIFNSAMDLSEVCVGRVDVSICDGHSEYNVLFWDGSLDAVIQVDHSINDNWKPNAICA
jgi:prepilin-type processing-associated H-X9-DG protein